jgi:demethylmenaquinone methyltransferase/2-methoxy-6-polyprenyl-1,4-benzoquinol methylase
LLTGALHRIAAQPAIYDAIQVLAGSGVVNRRLAERLRELSPPNRLLDLGGGTGLALELVPAGATYVSVDLDPLKLEGFRRKHLHGVGIAGDATRLPFGDGTFDLVICKMVSHHLTDKLLPLLFQESARVLRPGAHLVFVDAVLDPGRVRSRLLWRYDRGSHPRAAATLREAMSRHFGIAHWDEFAIHHRYVLGVGSTPA